MSAVVVQLIGGLGNQMFQYAVGRAISARCKVPLLLDVSGFEKYSLRRYELDAMAIDACIATRKELAQYNGTAPHQNILMRTLDRFNLSRKGQVLAEASYSYDERVVTVDAPVYLKGYWQTERYFAHLADDIRREFSLKNGFDSSNEKIAQLIDAAGDNSVSLHIRRGDYVNNPHTAQYHGVCSLDYYKDAVAHVAGHLAAPHFFVFSDDHTWVIENFNIGHQYTLVDVNGPDRGIWDMALMKRCRHHIIANSSFSWWGAWLNPSQKKIVVTPKHWFAGANLDTKDLIPCGWLAR